MMKSLRNSSRPRKMANTLPLSTFFFDQMLNLKPTEAGFLQSKTQTFHYAHSAKERRCLITTRGSGSCLHDDIAPHISHNHAYKTSEWKSHSWNENDRNPQHLKPSFKTCDLDLRILAHSKPFDVLHRRPHPWSMTNSQTSKVNHTQQALTLPPVRLWSPISHDSTRRDHGITSSTKRHISWPRRVNLSLFKWSSYGLLMQLMSHWQ